MCGSHYQVFSRGEPLTNVASQHEVDLLLPLSRKPRMPARRYKKIPANKSHCMLHYPALLHKKQPTSSTLRAGKLLVFLDG